MAAKTKAQSKLKQNATPSLQNLIFTIREEKVILDSDLADNCAVETKRLNEQVRRNESRFPLDFSFVRTQQEFAHLKSQCATSSSHGGRRKTPRVFTEYRALMAAIVDVMQRILDLIDHRNLSKRHNLLPNVRSGLA